MNSPDAEKTSDQIILSEYAQAQEVALHTDTVIHEVAAIVWGANTLLLGFILEVPCKPENQWLVVVASVLGIFMSAYVPWVQWLTKRGQTIAFEVCREIEEGSGFVHKLHSRIHAAYPKKRGQAAIWFLTICFVVGWCWVIHHAWVCLHPL